MVLSQCILMADEIKPNAYSDEMKTAWLGDCEGMVQTEILLRDPQSIVTYSYEHDHDAVLLVRPPHDKLYLYYLTAMIDFANGEYQNYQNTMQVFNAAFASFMRYYAQHYRPADRKNPKEAEERYRYEAE